LIFYKFLLIENKSGEKKGSLPEIEFFPQAARNKRQILVFY
jgi:hypothetical protein